MVRRQRRDGRPRLRPVVATSRTMLEMLTDAIDEAARRDADMPASPAKHARDREHRARNGCRRPDGLAAARPIRHQVSQPHQREREPLLARTATGASVHYRLPKHAFMTTVPRIVHVALWTIRLRDRPTRLT
jgi:hypothetical protein